MYKVEELLSSNKKPNPNRKPSAPTVPRNADQDEQPAKGDK